MTDQPILSRLEDHGHQIKVREQNLVNVCFPLSIRGELVKQNMPAAYADGVFEHILNVLRPMKEDVPNMAQDTGYMSPLNESELPADLPMGTNALDSSHFVDQRVANICKTYDFSLTVYTWTPEQPARGAMPAFPERPLQTYATIPVDGSIYDVQIALNTLKQHYTGFKTRVSV
jgi:hypothetical protein